MILVEHYYGGKNLSVIINYDDKGYFLSWQTGGRCGLYQLPVSLRKKVLKVIVTNKKGEKNVHINK